MSLFLKRLLGQISMVSSRMKLVIVRRLACQNVRMLVPLEETIEICTRKDRVQPRKDSTV